MNPAQNSPQALDRSVPDDFVEFLALDLGLPREGAHRALVALLRDYRSCEQRPEEAWLASSPQPLS